MRFWRLRPGFRRRRRFARGAGIPDQVTPLLAFEPSEIDVEAFRSDLEGYADGLAESVDDVTGHALNGLVNARIEQWILAMDVQYHTYLAQAVAIEGDFTARATLTRQLWMEELNRLVEMGMAVDATLTDLIEERNS